MDPDSVFNHNRPTRNSKASVAESDISHTRMSRRTSKVSFQISPTEFSATDFGHEFSSTSGGQDILSDAIAKVRLSAAKASHERFEELLANLALEHEQLWNFVNAITESSQVLPVGAGEIDTSDWLRDLALEASRNRPLTPSTPHVARDVIHTPDAENIHESSEMPESITPPSWDGSGNSFLIRTQEVVDLQSPLSSSHRDGPMLFMKASSLPTQASSVVGAEYSEAAWTLPPSVITRLRCRLGVLEYDGVVSARALFQAITSLGLETFTEGQIEKLLVRMVTIHEKAENDSLENVTTVRPPSKGWMSRSRLSFDLRVPRSISSLGSEHQTKEGQISFQVLLEFLMSETKRQLLGPVHAEKVAVIKEVLLSGDANRLVAELTQVRVDQLASPAPPREWGYIFEPIVGVVILINGVTIGLQTDNDMGSWNGWIWIDCTFTLFYVFEIIFRIRTSDVRTFFFGPDRAWSFFDTFLVVAAVIEAIIDITDVFGKLDGTVGMIRIIRLGRLTRLIRLFRHNFLKELNIMIKGLLAGVRTLCWALVLLFFTVYVLAVLVTHTVGDDPRNKSIRREELFNTVPKSMLTLFRCFVGDCTTSQGEPIVKLMSDAFGFLFVIGYVASVTMVTLGLFNLIMALYVEITMAAAKRTEEKDAHRRARESLRVARITKELLKKVCVLQSAAQEPPSMKQQMSQPGDHHHQDVDADMVVSREDFLLIIQDQDVQRLMNELDIPPDRASLFEVLDADGTGDLHVTELVHGLLKIRGEARKSDIVAVLLAVRAVQEMIRAMEDRMEKNHIILLDHFGIIKRVSGKKTIWDRIGNSLHSKTASSSRLKSVVSTGSR